MKFKSPALLVYFCASMAHASDIENACFNCPPLDKVADAATFNDGIYYANALAAVSNNLSASEIKTAITAAISQNHKQLTYSEVWTALTQTDEDPNNPDNVILLYRGNSIPKFSNGSGTQSSNPDNWNREHVWAKSHGFPDSSQEGYTDIHHLRPADISVNSARGNLDFDNSDAPLTEAPLNRVDGDSFEPRDAVKGDVARMVFYMDTRYEGMDSTPDLQVVDRLTSGGEAALGRLCRLLEWNNADPVDATEQRRNDRIYELQGNRNPYIDHPEWVTMLYSAATCTDSTPPDGGGTPPGDGGGTPPNDGGTTPTSTDTSLLFINEIHYDNSGSDTGEAIEIAGPAGTDLTGLSLVLYNGRNGTTYKTVALSGVLSNMQAGFGTLSFAISGIQNGAPDGMALVDADSNVLQFLSYEGAFTATNGPANGTTSTDIGVSEASSTNTGFSLQLAGTGFKYNDFTWQAAASSTFDQVNTDQTFEQGSVFINEIHYDNSGTDSNEGIEIAGSAGTDLSGLSLVLYNGKNGTTYKTTALSGVISNQQNGFGTVFFAISGIQNGAPDGVALIDSNNNIIQFLSYEGSLTATNGPASGMSSVDIGVTEPSNTSVGFSLQLSGTGINSEDFSWQAPASNTFGTINTNQNFGSGGNNGGDPISSIGLCNDSANLISAIQGEGDVSPVADKVQIIEGVVSAVLPSLSGFFVQEELVDYDNNSATSEGIFVYNNKNSITPNAGDVVRVIGSVSERYGKTQISASEDILTCGSGSVTATNIPLPFNSLNDLEALEGMLVSNGAPLTVSDNYELGHYGEVDLSNGRLFNPTNLFTPNSTEAINLAATNKFNKITLDDLISGSNPSTVIYPTGGLSANNTLRTGDEVTALTGIMDFSYSKYRILPTSAPTFIVNNPRTASPELLAGNVKVASLNVLNLFNGDGNGNGFPTSRGADSLAEYERQIAKTVSALVAINADVVGLMEIENDGVDSNSTIVDLITRLNAQLGANTYTYINTGGTVGTDAIAVALLYKPSVVTPATAVKINNNAIFNRPPLAQLFSLNANGEKFTVVVNHFKSKGGCSRASGLDKDQGDGQACFNARRVAQANELMSWLSTDSELSSEPDVLIIGDLNSYAKEDPISTITNSGYINLINQFVGNQGYSYAFGGELGYLDHALASPSLLAKTLDATEWHINADEPRVLDYNVESKSAQQQNDFYAPDAYRMSDHDPLIVSLDIALRGDWDRDDDVDVFDMRSLILAIQHNQPINPAFDLNEDKVINMIDVRVLRTLCTRRGCAP